jgi:hypothetical protein
MLISALLAAYTTGVGILFRALLKAKDDQILAAERTAQDRVNREREITDRVIPAIEEHTATVKRLIQIQGQTWGREGPEYRELEGPPPATTRRTARGAGERTP